VDVFGNRKPSFYITKRALAKVVVGMERVVTREPSYITMGYLAEKGALEVWAVNGYTEVLEAVLKLKAVDIETGEEVKIVGEEKERVVKLKPNQSNEIVRIDIPNPEQTVIVAYLDSMDGKKRLARWISWPEPLKFVRFKKDLKVEAKIEGDEVVLSSNAPAKGVVVGVPLGGGKEPVSEDNFVDVVPGEDIRIKVRGLEGRKLEVRWNCDWEGEEGSVL
jgi:beta-mannosidase